MPRADEDEQEGWDDEPQQNCREIESRQHSYAARPDQHGLAEPPASTELQPGVEARHPPGPLTDEHLSGALVSITRCPEVRQQHRRVQGVSQEGFSVRKGVANEIAADVQLFILLRHAEIEPKVDVGAR